MKRLPIPRVLFVGFIMVFHFIGSALASVHNVRDYGAKGDGITLDTEAINQAIASAANEGGGTVLIPSGDYLCYSIHLRSHVSISLEQAATLIAADSPEAGRSKGYDAPEPNAFNQYQDFGHSHIRNSLIWGENLDDVSIVGPGMIYGRGLSRGNGRKALPVGQFIPETEAPPPDVLGADGVFTIAPRPDLISGPFAYPNARDTLPDGVGNKAIALLNCRNVLLRDFSILHGGHFALLATATDNLTIDNLKIDTNRDGMDIDSCNNVKISNCSVNSPWDDGICLKADFYLGYPRPCENVTITNCAVSGFVEGTLLDGRRIRESARYRGKPMGRIKLGTESNGGYKNITITNCVFEHCRGLALETVDGGVMENIVVSNLTMRQIFNAPIFIRLGLRQRAPQGTAPSIARGIQISNIVASEVASEHGILLLGCSGHPLEEISLSDIKISFSGGGTKADGERVLPELDKGYPEPYVFGRTPVWGLFARHVAGLRIRDLRLSTETEDKRAPVWIEDVSDFRYQRLEIKNPSARIDWVQSD